LPSYKLLTNNYSKDDKAKTIPLSNGCSIEEYLQEQITFKDVDNKIKKIALYIVGSLDGSGYLRREEQDIIDDILFITGTEVSTKERKEAMSLVHSLEPHGVGARNLQEALTLQLKYHLKNTDVNTALQILENHFDLFVKKHYDKIMAKMGISEDLLKRALAIITNLSPKPANLYVSEGGQNEPTIQIVPDFILDNSRGYSELILNKYNTPEVKVSPGYLKMLEEIIKESKRASALERRGREGDMEAAAFIKQKIDSAKWFITAIKQRNATLLLTMNTILQLQKEYFEYGDETKLRPMILKDVADRTGLDVSTISRVVNSKYIQTDFGIFSLKFFFSEAMKTTDGEEVSSREIKKILSNCVEEED
ncbi:MAG: RNA polymerase factor sigma-54, partial [Rikenellaceae bacterium]